MTRMEKIFVGLGAGTTALLAIGFGMVAFHGPYNYDNVPKPATQATTAAAAANPSIQPPAPAIAGPVNLEALPANAPMIPEKYIDQLSQAVNLAAAPVQPPDKAEWTRALPYAQKLMDGPCDCAQKVWLKHFIEMGNYALADSSSDYHQTASLLVTLGRNDDEAMELSKKAK